VQPAQTAVDIVAKKAEAWKAEERRKAEQEQTRINEQKRLEAEAKAAADRKERDKQIAKAQKMGELSKKQADSMLKQSETVEKQAQQRAEKEAAQTASNVQMVNVSPMVPKVAGIKARVNWKFRILNEALVTRDFLKADEVKIGAKVREIKNKRRQADRNPSGCRAGQETASDGAKEGRAD